MQTWIKGITVTLHIKTKTSEDPFGAPIYSDSTVQVNNVIVSPVTAEDASTDLALHGKRTIYELGVPKGDTHTWTDTDVEFFGKRFMAVGPVVEGIEDMVPLSWHKKVRVALYE